MAVVVVAAGAGVRGWSQLSPGPRQPIPFSHKLHVTQKGISCFFCHTDADRSSHPGMPAVEKCRLCHKVIIPEFGPIQVLHESARKNEGVPWQRVNQVPDFVYFSHQAHVARGFDCSRCHGNVKEMDRVHRTHWFDMGFCVNCHEQNNASTDCWMCHR